MTAAHPTDAPRNPGGAPVPPFTSLKLRFFAFLAMGLLVYVHGYDLRDRYLQPWSLVDEPMAPDAFVEYLVANGLFRFFVPLFFAISGYLFALGHDAPFWPRLRRRARTLLVPYLLWSAIGLLVTALLESWPPMREAIRAAHLAVVGDMPVARYGWRDCLVTLVLVPLPFQLWFLRCLFTYDLCYPLLERAVMRFPRTTLGVAALLWVTTFQAWFAEGEGLLFFLLGVRLCRTRRDIEAPPAWLRLDVAAFAWVVLAAIKTWLAFRNDPALQPLLALLHKTVVGLGVMVAWYGMDGLVRSAMRRPWFTWAASFSFMIYAAHVPLLTYLMNWLLPLVADVPGSRLLVFLLLPPAVAVSCVLLGAALRRVTPPLYDVLTGGRGT